MATPKIGPSPRPARRYMTLVVNGEYCEVAVEPQWSLLRVLREELGLSGAKKACDSGGCGSCTVLLDGNAVYSCMVYALAAEGKSVSTVEGLKQNGALDPVQDAFIEAGAVQCGYCTCGMILAAKALLAEHPHPSEEQIRRSLTGNLCRCTGYQKIVEAIGRAANGS